jgi:hypothetical protein
VRDHVVELARDAEPLVGHRATRFLLAFVLDPPALPEVLEVERTPLSSRMVIITDRTSNPPGSSETPLRPSIMIRRKTHRAQNIVAAIALLVIIVLVLLGRKSSDEPHDAAKDAPGESASLPAPPKAPAHKPAAKPTAAASTASTASAASAASTAPLVVESEPAEADASTD